MPYQDDHHNDEQNTKANDETKGEWVLVDDPSSGEPFYWNSETGEMEWEIE